MPNLKNSLTGRLLGALIATTALIVPAVASAQAAYEDAGSGQQIQGTVAAINGTWNITVADANGYADSVELHQGTIINPTGLTLEPGMNVTVDGYANGPNFDAMEIDTPYQYQGPAPVAVYYGPGAWYPGYASGWGPSFSLVFDFGNRRFEERSFVADGAVRRPMTPPSGWQDRPHGYIGNAGNRFPRTAYAPQQSRSYVAPQRQYVAPQRQYVAPQRQYVAPQRQYVAPQQQPARSYAAPQRQYVAPQRQYVAPQQQPARSFAPPQQTTRFAPQQQYVAPQQQPARSFAPPQQSTRFSPQRQYVAPQQQPARNYSAPPQQQGRAYAAPAARGAAPAPRNSGPQDNRRHG